jgi:hypothetical protein
MVTLISVYFEYIKILSNIFTKYIVPILQVYPHVKSFFTGINVAATKSELDG